MISTQFLLMRSHHFKSYVAEYRSEHDRYPTYNDMRLLFAMATADALTY